MRGSWLVIILVLAACSKKDNSPHGLCERGCAKLLGCLPNGDSQIPSCVQSCLATGQSANQAQIEKLEAMSCDEIARGANGGVPANQAAEPGAAPARARNGCTADCTGCVGDDTSCYAAAGGANGIPCDSCCCAPGGPAPTWRTE